MSEKRVILGDILGRHYKSGDELLFHCPMCNHHKNKLSVNLKKNVFKCWVCSYSGVNLRRIVRRYGNFLQRQRWDELAGTIDLARNFYDEMFGEEIPEEEAVISLPEEFVSLANKDLPFGAKAPKKYLRRRGITQEDIVKWKIGYCSRGEYEGRIIIPSFNEDGKVNYFIARSYRDEIWPPYKNPPADKDIVFNQLYVDLDEPVVIVEGVFDAIKAYNSIPMLGSTLREDSKLFQVLALNDTPVYTGLDPDAEKKAVKLIEKMISYDMEVYKIDVEGYEDIGEMTKEEFLERKQNAKLMTSDSLMEYRVRSIR